MNSPGRDLASKISAYLGFRDGHSLGRTNRFWKTQYDDSIECWIRWYHEIFGLLSANYALDSLKSKFQRLWNARRSAHQAVPTLPDRFKPYFYFRQANRPCVFVSGYYNNLMMETGDLILSPDRMNENNSQFPNRGVLCWHHELTPLDTRDAMRESTPRVFSFPDIPLSFYYQILIPCVVHIRMNPSDLKGLKFHTSPMGQIEWYTDPRLPGIQISITARGQLFTIEIFRELLVINGFLHVELHSMSTNACHIIW